MSFCEKELQIKVSIYKNFIEENDLNASYFAQHHERFMKNSNCSSDFIFKMSSLKNNFT